MVMLFGYTHLVGGIIVRPLPFSSCGSKILILVSVMVAFVNIVSLFRSNRGGKPPSLLRPPLALMKDGGKTDENL